MLSLPLLKIINKRFFALYDRIRCRCRTWEFPGGKVEQDEDTFVALEREIKEEFNCRIVTDNQIFAETTHDYGSFIIDLIAIKATLIDKKPVLTEHAQYIWLKRDNLFSLNWAPADIPIVEKLLTEKNRH